MQRHPLPGKRQHQLIGRGGEPPGMQGGIQDRRMDPEALHRRILGSDHFRIDFAPPPPHRAQPAKCRSVAITTGGESVVDVTHIHSGCAHRRPHRQVGTMADAAGAQHAFGMQHPRIAIRSRRKHRHGPPARFIGAADDQLYPHRAGLRQRQRCQQGQLLYQRAADLIARPQRQLHESGARKQHHPVHRVIA